MRCFDRPRSSYAVVAWLLISCGDDQAKSSGAARSTGGTGGRGTGGGQAGSLATSGGIAALGGAPTSGGTSASGGIGGGGSPSGAGGAPKGGDASGGTPPGGASAGGSASGGTPKGGAATGGTAGGRATGGTATGGTGGGPPASAYPCDGTTAGYHAVVAKSGSTWEAKNGSKSVYSGNDMLAAMQAGVDSLTAGRTAKQSVLVQGSGSVSATTRLNLASYTVLNVCGTIDVTGAASGDNAPIYARERTDIEVPNATITGTPGYALFFRNVNNLHLGKIELRITSGLGIRVDNHGGDRAMRSTNLKIDDVYVEGTDNQGVETYGVDGIVIGQVVARNVGYSGLLLNDSVNAEIGLVDGEDVASGSGYAVFRMANRNGRIGNSYEPNVHVRKVVARGGGRGVFCVSESGGAVIDQVDIEGTENNSILIENCYNVTIGSASLPSRVANSGELRVAARDEFANTSDVRFQNIVVTDTPVRESPCADSSTWLDVTADSTYSVCD
jgi:hypothetical protein